MASCCGCGGSDSGGQKGGDAADMTVRRTSMQGQGRPNATDGRDSDNRGKKACSQVSDNQGGPNAYGNQGGQRHTKGKTSDIRGGRGSRLYDTGVSESLAQLRRREIRDVRYSLSFSIPEDEAGTVTGEMDVTFRIGAKRDVILDFRGGGIVSTVVNGSDVGCHIIGEHLVFGRKYLRRSRNKVHISFMAGTQSLNRSSEYLYTLLVPERARTLFPCFDQPDLKAKFTLSLEVPQDWQAVSNAPALSEEVSGGRKKVSFAETEPLSTYLFSFVAGKLGRKEYVDGERVITAYYRETDPARIAQLDTIFRQVAASLRWMEDYTGIPYPFAKYDFIILPGFQYGGMEHTGATLYNDRRMFLGGNPTPDEELARLQLIAHETAHIWFGDLVTMEWFDDVWTKEVFANYFAARISEPMFPDINHRLNWMKSYTALALAEDRTPGTTAIHQDLGNLRDAGLLYGNIVYDKAPVMMEKLVELMGETAFRNGIRKYLKAYPYGNATWDDLIRILDRETPQDLAAFSEVWVGCKGMPHISFEAKGRELTVRQEDPYSRGLAWPQSFDVRVCGEGRDTTLTVTMWGSDFRAALPFEAETVLPNVDGRGYGLLIPDEASLGWLLAHWHETTDETARLAFAMLLNENYHARRIGADKWLTSILRGLRSESNPLIASSLAGYVAMPLREVPQAMRGDAERELYALSLEHPLPSCRTALLRTLYKEAYSPDIVARLETLWERQGSELLSEADYTAMAYELSLRLPTRRHAILARQRSRISDPDRLRQFDFVSRFTTADTAQADSLFESLLRVENRKVEPWAVSALGYLCHPARGAYPVKYILPGLDELETVQITGDIFLPGQWVDALLSGQLSKEAYDEVASFLRSRPDYPKLLTGKILQSAYPLYRLYGDSPAAD